MYPALCVQYHVRATADRAESDKVSSISKSINIKGSSISKLKTKISGNSDIEGVFVDFNKSSISGHYGIEGKTFGIEVSSISYNVDIEALQLRYRSFSEFRPSLSKLQNFDIRVIEVEYRIRVIFHNFDIEVLSL